MENYEKKYKEALERAKTSFENANGMVLKKWLVGIFPELAESEDERIRKRIYNYINVTLDDNESAEKEKWLAWLEKQDESIKIKKGKNYLCTKTHKYAGVEWREGIKYYSPEDYSLVNQGCTCYCPKYSKEEHNNFFKEVEYDGCLEKQGEQKSAYKPKFKVGDKIRRKTPSSFDKDMQVARIGKDYYVCNNIGKFSSEVVPFSKQSGYELIEQNPANNIEPKFKVGDWIVNNQTSTIFLVKSIRDDEYCIWPLDAKIEGFLRIVDVDSEYHLWTIKDAKDGDVLVSKDKSSILIFKNLDTNTSFSSYYNIAGQGELGWSNDCFVPATKEQRDLLFQKMKEAGYAFDFEKKELKKIDNEEVNGEDYGIDGLWHAQRILEKTLGSVDGYQTDDGILDHKVAITTVKKLYGQKSAAWSEEDEQMIGRIRGIVEKYAFSQSAVDVNGDLCEKEYIEADNWLKTLKQRIGG